MGLMIRASSHAPRREQRTRDRPREDVLQEPWDALVPFARLAHEGDVFTPGEPPRGGRAAVRDQGTRNRRGPTSRRAAMLKARLFSAADTPAGDSAVHASPLLPGSMRPVSTLVPVTQNRDWRTYDWVQRHSAAVALMRERQPEIVMLGDSITHFWGGDPVGGPRNGPDEWDRAFVGRRVVNLGYGGTARRTCCGDSPTASSRLCRPKSLSS
jgi:hypothetical protein